MPVTASDLETAITTAIPDISHLEIKDESDGCGDKYSVLIVSEVFVGKTTLQRHRFVNERLREHIAQIHAFSQQTLTPAQYEALEGST